MSFPGPSSAEAGATGSTRKPVGRRVRGRSVTAGGTDYTLGVVGDVEPRFGGALAKENDSFHLPAGLPSRRMSDLGSSIAVDFEIAPASRKRSLLSWRGTRPLGGKPRASFLARLSPEVP